MIFEGVGLGQLRDLCDLLGIDLAYFFGLLEKRIATGKSSLRGIPAAPKKNAV